MLVQMCASFSYQSIKPQLLLLAPEFLTYNFFSSSIFLRKFTDQFVLVRFFFKNSLIYYFQFDFFTKITNQFFDFFQKFTNQIFFYFRYRLNGIFVSFCLHTLQYWALKHTLEPILTLEGPCGAFFGRVP